MLGYALRAYMRCWPAWYTARVRPGCDLKAIIRNVALGAGTTPAARVSAAGVVPGGPQRKIHT